MNNDDLDFERGSRLRELRINKGKALGKKITQIQLFDDLQEIMPVNPNKKDETIVNGSKSISKIENGHAFSLRYALAYAEYFNVSLEYLYGLSDIKQPGYDDVINKLGLSDDALHNLELLNRTNKNLVTVLNMLLNSNLFPMFKELLNHYSEYANIDAIKHLVHYPNMVRLDNIPTSQLILRNINLDSKTFVRLSKEEISDTAKRIADEIKKSGGKQ